MSMIATCCVSPIFSRTQMYLSLSMVRVANPILAGLMPKLVRLISSWNLMGRFVPAIPRAKITWEVVSRVRQLPQCL